MNWKRLVLLGTAAAAMGLVGCRNTNQGVGGSGSYGKKQGVGSGYLLQDKSYGSSEQAYDQGEPGGTGGSGMNGAAFVPVCGGPNGSRF